MNLTRRDIVLFGVFAAVIGALIGGLLLGLGLSLAGNGQPIGLLFIVPAPLVAAGIGWWVGRRFWKSKLEGKTFFF